MLITFSDGGSQTFQLGVREYRLMDGKWYTFTNGRQGDEIIPSRLVVRLKDRGDLNQLDFSKLGLRDVSIAGRRFLDGFYVLSISSGQEPFSVAKKLDASSLFDVIEFDAYGKRLATPDDLYFPNQWNLDNAKLRMESAWNISIGKSSVILAIIDSGTDYDHEDLDGNVWNNSDEFPGDGNGDGYPGVAGVDDDEDGLIDEDSQGRQPGEPGYTNDLFEDDDENGYIDDFVGWDFAGNGNNPQLPFTEDNDPDDTDSHGTAVTGIAGAQTHNEEGGNYIGIAGIAGGWGSIQGVQLMILRDGGYDPIHSLTAQAIEYAAENGARVINLSTGFSTNYTDVRNAVNFAVNDSDVVIIASAGNNGGTYNQDRSIRYPARYSNTIAIGATDQNDVRWEEDNQGSAVGPELDVMAPTAIWTTDITGSAGYSSGNYYSSFGGTSAAAPHVAGLSALIRSVNPSYSWQDVRDIIRDTADEVLGMGDQDFTEEYGYGRINAYQGVKDANELLVPSEYTTIQAAINLAYSGNDVKVSAFGTYNESIDMKSRVDVIGEGVTYSYSTINRTGPDYVVKFYEVNNAKISGFRLNLNGSHYGVYARYCNNITIENIVMDPLFSTASYHYGIRVMNSSNIFIDNNIMRPDGYHPTGISIGSQVNSFSITDNVVAGPSGYRGIICSLSNGGTIEGNIITNNSQRGISLNSSSPYILENEITLSDIGIRARYGSDPDMNDGYNIIYNNNIGVYCTSASEPYLRLYNNLVNSDYDIYAFNNVDDIYAESVYWGEDPPNESQMYHDRGISWIHYVPWLDDWVFPGGMAMMSKRMSPDASKAFADKYLSNASSSEDDSTAKVYNRIGRQYFYEAKHLERRQRFEGVPVNPDSIRALYLKAIAEFEFVINIYPHSPIAQFSLDHLVSTHWAMEEGKQVFSYLEQLADRYPDKMLGGIALELSIRNLLDEGKYDQAIATIENLRARFPNTEMSKNLLLYSGIIYKYYLDDKKTAKEIFEATIQQYPEDDDLVAWTIMELEELDISKPGGKTSGGTETDALVLFQNYPNPSNPTTNISYRISATGKVSLKVFNILGQEVKTLVDEYKEAGHFTIHWDGSNNRGREVASGVYIYRIEIQTVNQETMFKSRKLMLLR